MHAKARYWIDKLELQPHPEGGWYRESYRSEEMISASALPERFGGSRCFGTAIYYLLEGGQCSHLHRIKSDELWHFYDGDALSIHMFPDTGSYQRTVLGRHPQAGEYLQAVVPAGCWFGAELSSGSGFALVGCTVAPGFDLADFELANRQVLMGRYPDHRNIIMRLTRVSDDGHNACKMPSS